jgi:hypothetical protein
MHDLLSIVSLYSEKHKEVTATEADRNLAQNFRKAP